MLWVVGWLGGFLTWLGGFFVKATKTVIQVGIIVTINLSLFAVLSLYIYSIYKLVWWVYTSINDLSKNIISSNSDTVLSFGVRFSKSLGIWDGFVDAFSILSFGFILLFSTYFLKIAYKVLMGFRNSVLAVIISLK